MRRSACAREAVVPSDSSLTVTTALAARVTAAITHPAWHSGTWIKGRLANQAAVVLATSTDTLSRPDSARFCASPVRSDSEAGHLTVC